MTKRHLVVAGIVGVAVALLVLAVMQNLRELPRVVPPPAAAAPTPVTVAAGLNETVAAVSGLTEFWLSITNGSTLELRDVSLSEISPSWMGLRICWEGVPKAQESDCPTNLPALGLGQSAVARGTISVPRIGTFVPAVVTAWTADGKYSRRIVSLGPLHVERGFSRWASALAQVAKDYALPLALLVFGLYVNQKLKAYESALARRGSKRAQLTETWNLMLPKSHDYTVNHYMGMESAMRGAIQKMDAIRAAGQPATADVVVCQAFYNVLLFERRRKHLRETSGGFYFKDRVGEKLAVYPIRRYKKLWLAERDPLIGGSQTDQASYQVRLERVLERMTIKETFDVFSARLPPEWRGQPSRSGPSTASGTILDRLLGLAASSTHIDRDLEALIVHFSRWVHEADSAEAINCLRVSRLVIEHEMNRPYRYWYGDQEPLVLDRQGLQKDMLLKFVTEEAKLAGDDEETLREAAESYLKRETGRRLRGVKKAAPPRP